MANVPLENPGRVNVEGLIDLATDVVKLAIRDARKGPGRQAKTRIRYNSTLDFLDRIGVLERVAELHGIDIQGPRQQTLLDV